MRRWSEATSSILFFRKGNNMRVRKRAGAEELVQAHPEFVVAEPIWE